MLETTTKTVAYHQATSLVLLKHPTPHVIACGEHAYYTLAEFALVLQVSIAGMSNRHTTIWRGLAAQPSAMGCVPCSGDAPRTEALRTITLRAVGADGLAW